MHELVRDFLDEKVAIQILDISHETINELAELIKDAKVYLTNYRIYDGVKDYIEECVREHWELLAEDEGCLNAYRDDTAKTTTKKVFTAQEFIDACSTKISISEDNVLEVLNV